MHKKSVRNHPNESRASQKRFHVVASLGSFTEAAKALYMTQPAVSQQNSGGSNMHSAIRFSIEVNVRYD